MDRSRIIIDGRMINHAGIGTYLRQLINVLNHYYDVTIISAVDGNYPNSCKLINSNSKIYSIKEQLELPIKIPESDLFISPHFNIPLINWKGRKKLTIIHDVFHLAFLDTLSISQKLYANIFIRAAVKFSDVVVTISEFSRNEIIKYTGADINKIKVIPFGFNRDEFVSAKSKADFERIKKQYNIPENYILFVGSVKPHKNLKNLVKAFKRILECEKDIRLVIVGKREGMLTEDKELYELINNDLVLKNSIIFTGYVNSEDLPSIYSFTKLFVFPSLYEGFGIPPLEAMACGCAVAASNILPVKEVCADAVIYFNPNDPDEIADKIINLLRDENLRDNLISLGYNNLNRFTLSRFEDNWIKTINDLI